VKFAIASVGQESWHKL